MNIVGGCVGAFLQTGVRQHVHHDMVGGAHQAFDHAKAGCPAGWIQHHFFHLQKLGDLALERDGVRRVADQSR